jgi:hypothetical protein
MVTKAERAERVPTRRERVRVADKKLAARVTLFAAIEADQHEALRTIAFAERRSLADVVREALGTYLTQHSARRRPVTAKR